MKFAREIREIATNAFQKYAPTSLKDSLEDIIELCNNHLEDRTEPNTLYQNDMWLKSRYEEEGLSMAEIGNVCGVSPTTINKWLIKHNIPTRGRGRIKGKRWDNDS